MKLRRTTFVITQKCTLKCRLCLAFIPYYESPLHTSYKEAETIIDNYFRLVDMVEIFSITGGEPLMNPDLVAIVKKVLQYRKNIEKSIDIVTNGTIMFHEKLLRLLEENRECMRVIVSNYGENLSTKAEEILHELEVRDISYRVQNYDQNTNEWTYNGWVDFTDHTLKHCTEEELLEQGRKCIFRLGHYYVINDGELHPCSRQYWRMRQEILERDSAWYINLNEKEMKVAREREKLKTIEEKVYLKSCAYCDGCYNGIKRYKPAEQL